MALVRAYEGWKDAEREGSSYEYCWRNFLSVQTLQAIHSLRKQFTYILKDAGLLDSDGAINNRLSHNQSLVRAVICSGLFPGIASVVVSYSKNFLIDLAWHLSARGLIYILAFVHSPEKQQCLLKQWMMGRCCCMR